MKPRRTIIWRISSEQDRRKGYLRELEHQRLKRRKLVSELKDVEPIEGRKMTTNTRRTSNRGSTPIIEENEKLTNWPNVNNNETMMVKTIPGTNTWEESKNDQQEILSRNRKKKKRI